MSTTGATACFEKYGDKIWIKATASRSDILAMWENYLRDSSGSWGDFPYREGSCENHLGSGRWGYCNKDFYEDSTDPNARGGQGSGIRLWACAAQCAGYVWIRNNG
ncbi:hypothetical protein ACF1GY_37465 [Streptomyces sp. NPDC014684]|uniref:hypothetical protein n=1 Tax=Streptomyces sp. NPDC014684 TaxID=3364880 RepID=UPI00370326F0